MKEIRLPILHPAQRTVLATAKRFNVLKCGRRFGKTELAKDLIINCAIDGFPVAYFAPTYKDLSDFWIELKMIIHDVISGKDEQTKQIRLITGGKIDMWSLDQPDSGRGRKYKRVVIDECEKAGKMKEAWNGAIRPTLTDYIGDAWFLSTPKFGQTFFKDLYQLHADKKYEHEWQSWRFSTYDNPYINPKEIDAARATMDPQYFDCEYMAMDVELKGAIFRNIEYVKDIPQDARLIGYGLDFGFTNDPTALVEVRMLHGELWLNELIYETGLTNPQIAARMKGISGDVIADSAEPKSIVELRNYGVRIEGAKKGADSVRAGIEILMRYKINITERSVGLKYEIPRYCWKLNAQGESLNEPEDRYNHAIDATRYVALNKIGAPVHTIAKGYIPPNRTTYFD